jgi:hypothetical protein
MSAPAAPLFGDVLSYTVSPIASRMMWPVLTKKIFAPADVPQKFQGFPKEMAVRPSQIRASAGDAAFMIPDAVIFPNEYKKLKMPVDIIAGRETGSSTSMSNPGGSIEKSFTVSSTAYPALATWFIRQRPML